MFTVLGIDPGIASTGYGVVSSEAGRLRAIEAGVIETDSKDSLELRLAQIAVRIEGLVAAQGPDALAVEDIFFGRNVQTAFAVGQARGVVLAAAARQDVRCFAYTPQAIKLAVCGSGGAGKEQVQRMVGTLLGLGGPPRSDHVADALAVAICHAHREPARAAHEAAGKTSLRSLQADAPT